MGARWEEGDGLCNFCHVLHYINCVHGDFASKLFIKVLMPVYGFNYVSAVLQFTGIGFC